MAYIIRRQGNPADTARIDVSPWKNDFPEVFNAEARLTWSEKGIDVLLTAFESPVLARAKGLDGQPWKDSCLEFFFAPFEDDARYINIEVNPIGGACVEVGSGRNGRQRFTQAIPGMEFITRVYEDRWTVSYTVPMDFIASVYGKSLTGGQAMKGNFYTCSEDIHPHFTVWNEVASAKPDFHRPDCFGDIITE